jgi:hypothetical protein
MAEPAPIFITTRLVGRASQASKLNSDFTY